MPKHSRPAAPSLVVTLGRLGLEGPGAKHSARLFSQPKRLGVLLYALLSQRGGAITREKLIGVFWPESDASRARNALRQTLSFLRTVLGTDVIASVGAAGVAVSGALDCDAVRFESLLDANRKEEALRIYGGDFLPGFYIDGVQVFSEWLDARRRHLGQRAAKAAWDLSAECEARADAVNAAFWAKRALALSPFSESEVLRALRLLSRVGDYTGALRAFHGLQQSLLREFGAAPSAETARLAAEIMDRVQSSGQTVPALLGTRRLGTERRVTARRRKKLPWTGAERRILEDRRKGERRTGRDRRAVRKAGDE